MKKKVPFKQPIPEWNLCIGIRCIASNLANSGRILLKKRIHFWNISKWARWRAVAWSLEQITVLKQIYTLSALRDFEHSTVLNKLTHVAFWNTNLFCNFEISVTHLLRQRSFFLLKINDLPQFDLENENICRYRHA